MSDLELQFGTSKMSITFGLSSCDDLQQKICDATTGTTEPDLNRHYITVTGYGCEFLFEGGVLNSLVLTVSDGKLEGVRFEGEVSYLSKVFFENPTFDCFESVLKQSGFRKHWKNFPHSIDMLNDELRFRFTNRPDRMFVLIDDGSFLRNLPPSTA